MNRKTSKGARRQIIGRYADWVKTFEVQEYLENAPLIEKLHEEKQLALVSATEFEERLEAAAEELQEARLENQALRHQLEDQARRSFLVFFLSLCAVVLVGLGINLATNDPRNWTAWVFIGFGCVLETVAFFVKPRMDK